MSAKFNQTVAKDFVRRSNALGYKGKKRDDAMMDFMAGAISALEALKANTIKQGETGEQVLKKEVYFLHEELAEFSNHLCAVTAMLLATRGFKEVEVIATLEGVE